MQFLRRDYSGARKKITEIEDPTSLEFLVRVFGLAVPVMMGHFLAGMTMLIPWYLCVLASMGVLQLVNYRLRDDGSFGGIIAYMIAAMLQASVVAYLPYTFWQMNDLFFNYLGALLLVAGMVHTFIHRVTVLPTLLAVITPFFVVMVVVAYDVTAGEPARMATLAIGLTVLVAYIIIAMQRQLQGQKEYEIALTELAETRRVNAIARFVGGIAHDFNNLLTVIIGNLDLYDQVNDPKERAEFLSEARKSSERGAALVSNLLRYASKSPLNEEVCDLSALTRDLVETARRVVPAQIAIETHLPDTNVYVKLDKSQMDAAVLNLIINSAQAITAQGQILVRVRKTGPSVPSGYAQVEVKDTGTGISRDDIERVKEPFFTTKPVGKGSGLGLSSVDGFLRQSGGRMHIESTPSVGTCVTLDIPLVSEPEPDTARNVMSKETVIPRVKTTRSALQSVTPKEPVR